MGYPPVERTPFVFDGILIPDFENKYQPRNGMLFFREKETKALLTIGPAAMRDLVKCVALGYITPEDGGLRGFWEFTKTGSSITIVPVIP